MFSLILISYAALRFTGDISEQAMGVRLRYAAVHVVGVMLQAHRKKGIVRVSVLPAEEYATLAVKSLFFLCYAEIDVNFTGLLFHLVTSHSYS
ncbi:hypothetical protein SAMN05216516_102372 [Izhakiella capsodis]|uniref:Uncharacterized protein n=1 Tax=Izhakiella capsodis TaxID=1367852 RepID=A0A1I4WAI1_9GAMM|nr:hypothetical protein SAMN05216516_102372 [Izhakiella capsodis]